MALYFYQAYSKEGKKVTGYVDAPTLPGAKELLSKQGVYPFSIVPATQESALPWWKKLFARKVKTKDKILFTKQLSVLLKSGVPLLQSLELLTEQFEGSLKTLLVAIKDDIKEGTSLADALKKYPKVFENIYVQLVRAGEASGKLEVILDRLTDYLERRDELAKRVRSALSYPIMQLVFAVLVVVFLLTSVVPTLVNNLQSMGKQLPGTTAFIMGISNFITGHYLFLLMLIAALVAGFSYVRSTEWGRRFLDRVKLKTPIVGYFAKTNAIVQFSYTLGMLTEAGVNLAESLDIVVNIIDNQILKDALQEARDKIIKQGKIAQYLKQTHLFPPMATYLINTGEQTGKLDQMLLTVARNYEEELGEVADSLSSKLGPILLVVMALIVGLIVMAIIQPIMESADIGSFG